MSDVTLTGAAPIGVSVASSGAVSVDVQTAVPNVPFTAFTPVMKGTGSNPTLDVSSSGYYQRLGRRVWGYVGCTLATVGSGTYSLVLPVLPVSRQQPIGTGYLVDISNSVAFYLTAAAISPSLNADGEALFFLGGGAQLSAGNNPTGATVPFTWAAGDSLTVQFDYEAAA